MQDSFISLYSLDDLRQLVRRWRRLMRATGLAVFLPAAIVTLLLPPTYESTARLLLDRDRRTPDFAVRATPPDGAPLFRQVSQKEDLTTETERIRSRSVIAPVIAQLALTPEKLNHVRGFRRHVRRAYDWLLKTTRTAYNETRYALRLSTRPSAGDLATFEATALLNDVASRLRVTVVPDANVIEVSFQSSDGFLARDGVNAVVNEHLRQRSGKPPIEAEQFFLSQSRKMAAELRQHEELVDKLERELSAYAPEEQRRLILASMYGVEERLKVTHTDIARLVAKLELLKIQLDTEPESITTSREVARNPAFDAVNAQVVELELGRAKLVAEYQPGSRALQSIDEQIRIARQLQADIPKSLSGSITQAINLVHQNLKTELLAAQSELAALRMQERELRVSAADYRKQLAALSENELEVKDSRRLVAAQEQAYGMYLKNQEQARVSEEMAASDLRNLRILDAASLPLQAISPRPRVYLGVALATSLLMAFGVALLADQSDRSIGNRTQLRQAFDLPLLAEFPYVTIERAKA